MENSSNAFDLTGKVALITGAAGLLGQQHASALLDAGATVVLTDLVQPELAELKFNLPDSDAARLVFMQMDVTSPQDVHRVADQLSGAERPVSILINNAAVNPKVTENKFEKELSRLENFSIEEWYRQIDVGLTGAFLCSKIFGTEMAQSGKGGVILNIASDLSVIAPNQNLYRVDGLSAYDQPVKPVTYSVIKTGLHGLTKYLATYWSELGIRANSLSPGGVLDGQNDIFLEKIKPLIPLGRLAKPDEYRAAVQFLCSDASSYMTGQNLVIDGGRSVW